MFPSILIISNKEDQQGAGASATGLHHVRVLFAKSTADAEKQLARESINMMLIVLNDSDQDAFSFIRQSLKKSQRTKVMCFSNQDELSATLNALEHLPPEELNKLLSAGKRPSGKPEPAAPMELLSAASGNQFRYDDLTGSSPEMLKLKSLLLKIAPTGTTVLIQGESGTGKEVIARAIHFHSRRKNEVFMPVDCASINENVIESELFGHIRGAFTGADRETLGLIRSSDKGTLFLDEIAELPLHLQAKLLRTLQERAVKPVGSSKIYPVDIRIISATNCNLAEAVKKGTFRQDLYYRMSAITIYAPPLREHLSDMAQLCRFFIKKLVREGFPEKEISENALAALCAFNWPGNIRELENVIRNAVTLSQESVIRQTDLSIPAPDSHYETLPCAVEPSSMTFYEQEAIRKALNKTIGNRRAAAKILGISEATLYRRLKLYSI